MTQDSRAGERTPVLAVGAIFKNEGPYILEWIAFHQAVGVGRFFIADNGSDDGSGELLAALDRAGIIRHIPFPGTPGEPPQLPAYAEILRRHGAEADWIAFIDADEFLQPAPPERSLLPALAALADMPDVGAIVVNWAVYGSGGQTEARPEPVIERFETRARRNANLNRRYKSIVRVGACAGPEVNPHHFALQSGFRAVHVDGSDLELLRPRRTGVTSEVRWAPMRLNHYVVKSREEFFERKQRRGRATTADAVRDASFFDDHDRNEERAPMTPWLIAATRAGKNRLLAQLRAAGWTGSEPPIRHKGALRGPARATGRVDRTEIHGNTLRVRGWAVAAGGGQMAAFLLRADGQPVETIESIRRARPDVAERVPGAHPEAGFMLTLPWEKPLRSPLTLRALSPEGSILDLPVTLPEADGRPAPAATVSDEPMMPAEATAAFLEAIAVARCYLEYGSGGSTVAALRAGVPDLVTIESDRLWLAAVRVRVEASIVPGRHHLQHIDIGPTARFGYPASEVAWRKFGNYPLQPWTLVREHGLRPDLVLIDGRFRVASFLATLIHAPAGCRVLFDDYGGRDAYHRVTAFVRPRRLIDRMAEFVVPETRQTDALWPALLEAVGDPS
jgi:hypothetical protein